jgi:hypothetical protein
MVAIPANFAATAVNLVENNALTDCIFMIKLHAGDEGFLQFSKKRSRRQESTLTTALTTAFTTFPRRAK